MADLQIVLREHIKDTDWGVELKEDGTVHIYENVQRDAQRIYMNPEVWASVVKIVERLQMVQKVAEETAASERIM